MGDKGGTNFDTLSILQTVLEHPKDCIRLKIHDKVGASRKDAKCAFAGAGVCALAHGKRLSLQGMPGSPASHGIVGEIAYCVDGLSTNRIDVFVQKGMK